MAVRVLRRIKAATDAEAIADYIAKQSLDAAVRFLLQTEATLNYLAEFPGMGGRFIFDIPELAELRVCRVKGFPNHLIFISNIPRRLKLCGSCTVPWISRPNSAICSNVAS